MNGVLAPGRRSFLRAGAAVAVVGAPFIARAATDVRLNIATVAARRSIWHRGLTLFAKAVAKKTDGKVDVRVYPNGMMGDESAIVDKMRAGQLDGALLTGLGLSRFDHRLGVLRMPLTFRTVQDFDRVRGALTPTLKSYLADRDMALQGFADEGFCHPLSKAPIRVPSDFLATKVCTRPDDLILGALWDVVGVDAVPIDLAGVRSALATGRVNAVLAAPGPARRLSWHTEVAYLTDVKVAMLGGGAVLRRDTLHALPSIHREAIELTFAKAMDWLVKRVRAQNARALDALTETLAVVAPDHGEAVAWQRNGERTRAKLERGPLPPALVRKVSGLLES